MNLKFYRKEAGLTQKEVAARLGVAESTYNLYESEKRKIGLEDLLKLGELYGVTVDELCRPEKKSAAQKDSGQAERTKQLVKLFEDLPESSQDAVLRRLQEIVRLQKAQDDLLKF